jgi:hypothetical protein
MSLRAMIDTLRRWFSRFAPKRPAPAAPKPRAQRKPRPDLNQGGFYFRDAILDQLDEYFLVLGRMRKSDHNAYDYFSRVGAYVVPWRPDDEFDTNMAAEWMKVLPTRGGVFCYHPKSAADDEKHGWLMPRMVYFKKYDPPHAPRQIERVNTGAVYVVTIYWDDPANVKHGSPTEFPLAVTSQGEVRILRVQTRGQIVRSRRGGRFYAPTERWGIDDWFKTWAVEKNVSPVSLLTSLFHIYVSLQESAVRGSMTRIVATRDGKACAFSVDILRMPYFFADRDVRVGLRRKRIFHIVRTHERNLKGGRVSKVRTHFRGERDFTWNGYAVNVSVPGWHHFDLAELDIAGLDPELTEPGVKTVTDETFTGQLVDLMAQGAGAWPRAKPTSEQRKMR